MEKLLKSAALAIITIMVMNLILMMFGITFTQASPIAGAFYILSKIMRFQEVAAERMDLEEALRTEVQKDHRKKNGDSKD